MYEADVHDDDDDDKNYEDGNHDRENHDDADDDVYYDDDDDGDDDCQVQQLHKMPSHNDLEQRIAQLEQKVQEIRNTHLVMCEHMLWMIRAWTPVDAPFTPTPRNFGTAQARPHDAEGRERRDRIGRSRSRH